MSEPTKRSIRIDNENMDWLSSLPGKSLNEALTALRVSLAEEYAAESGPDSGITSSDTRIDEILELVRDLPDRAAIREVVEDALQAKIDERQAARTTNPASIPGVQVGAASLPKNAFCKHCGSKFAGNRFAQVCPECEEVGHKRVPPAECPECQSGNAL